MPSFLWVPGTHIWVLMLGQQTLYQVTHRTNPTNLFFTHLPWALEKGCVGLINLYITFCMHGWKFEYTQSCVKKKSYPCLIFQVLLLSIQRHLFNFYSWGLRVCLLTEIKFLQHAIPCSNVFAQYCPTPYSSIKTFLSPLKWNHRSQNYLLDNDSLLLPPPHFCSPCCLSAWSCLLWAHCMEAVLSAIFCV